MTRKPEPSDFYGGPPPEPYEKRGEVWKDEPQALPEGHPVREAWVAKIMERQHSPDGAPTPAIRQVERKAPDWTGPWVRKDPAA